jgi:uncharacterized membrane protein
MQMRMPLSWIAVTLLLSTAVHVAFVSAIPKGIMSVLMMKGSKDSGNNRMLHPARIDSSARKVVSPSPDLAYSICFYDLTDGRLIVTAPKPDTERYMSVALYDDSTNNFFVQNDRTLLASGLRLIITQEEDNSVTPKDFKIIKSPTKTGLVLIRRTFEGDTEWQNVDAERHLATCKTQ